MALQLPLYLTSDSGGDGKACNLRFNGNHSNVWLPAIPKGASLRLLSVVEVDKIPLYLSLGQPCPVSVDDAASNAWISSILANNGPRTGIGQATHWQDTARVDSTLGILLFVESFGRSHLNITEILLYASQSAGPETRPPLGSTTGALSVSETPGQLHALALNSNILSHPNLAEPTPPQSPEHVGIDEDGILLPTLALQDEVINEPPVRKRKSAADAFNEADARRKKAKGKGGQGVSAAAAPKIESQLPSLHRRSVSNSQPIPLQSRPLSRSPSVASSRPTTAVASGPQRSALSRVQSIAGDHPEGSDTEAKNKKIISRIVMAGMRLYGLSQAKRRQSDMDTSQALDREGEDDEYKLVYHQTYKGTCFAFRAVVDSQDLQPMSEAVRDVVDRLLTIFCNDPLAAGLEGGQSKLTPGGRKAFGSV